MIPHGAEAGLGLAICKGLVDAYGGRRPDRGGHLDRLASIKHQYAKTKRNVKEVQYTMGWAESAFLNPEKRNNQEIKARELGSLLNLYPRACCVTW